MLCGQDVTVCNNLPAWANICNNAFVSQKPHGVNTMLNLKVLQAQRDELNNTIINHPDYIAPVKLNSSADLFRKLQKCKLNNRTAFKYSRLQNLYTQALIREGK